MPTRTHTSCGRPDPAARPYIDQVPRSVPFSAAPCLAEQQEWQQEWLKWQQLPCAPALLGESPSACPRACILGMASYAEQASAAGLSCSLSLLSCAGDENEHAGFLSKLSGWVAPCRW